MWRFSRSISDDGDDSDGNTTNDATVAILSHQGILKIIVNVFKFNCWTYRHDNWNCIQGGR